MTVSLCCLGVEGDVGGTSSPSLILKKKKGGFEPSLLSIKIKAMN